MDEGDRFGTSEALAGARINLEFVSANPTGPLHAGGGRWVAVGDAVANLLAAQGAEVHREYYLNDAGAQLGQVPGLALRALTRAGSRPKTATRASTSPTWRPCCTPSWATTSTPRPRASGVTRKIVAGLQDDLGRIGVHFDTWFSERTLHERGDVDVVLRDLDARGVTFEADGAKWFRATDFGDQRDRVLIRSDGATTYLCNDFAYHRDKFARGYTHLIDIWGADHHGQVKSLQAGLEALGYPAGEPEIMLGQFVKLLQNGREVRLSKRTGNIIALADILDEVDPDVARMVFLLQGIDSPQTFDLDVVTAQSMDNPVYYVQYAHARIASIGRRADAAGVHAAADRVGRPVAAHARTRGRAAARARAVPASRRGRGRDARAAEGHDLGARLRPCLPRLLPRLSRAHRGRRVDPGPAVADGSVPGRPRQRARDPRRARARRDGAPRRRHRSRTRRMTA